MSSIFSRRSNIPGKVFTSVIKTIEFAKTFTYNTIKILLAEMSSTFRSPFRETCNWGVYLNARSGVSVPHVLSVLMSLVFTVDFFVTSTASVDAEVAVSGALADMVFCCR